MLKGKTVIELTDVKTGQVERYEDENIVTNALQEYMEALCLMFSADNCDQYLPIYKNALGGIRLYETALEESVTNVLMPSVGQSKTVGYASYTVKTNADARRGNLNQQETTVLDNGVQLVWDFATSEANGTIACMCLTPKENGVDVCSPTGGSIYFLDSIIGMYSNIFGIDEENGWLYTHNGAKAVKCKLMPNNIGLQKEGLFKPFEIVEVLGEWVFNNTPYNYYRLLDANTIYLIRGINTTSLIEYRINLQTGEKTEIAYTIQNASFNSGKYSYRFGNYTLFPHSGGKKMYKVNLSNISDVTLIDMPELVTSENYRNNYVVFRLQNGDAMYGNAIIDVASGSYDTMFSQPNHSTSSPCVAKYKGYKFLGIDPSGYNRSTYLQADAERLMTINNLQTPVTKTADKTMKITYTLLESEGA